MHALVIEDDVSHALLVCDTLRGTAHATVMASARKAIEALAWLAPDVVLADVRGTTDASPMEHALSLRLALDAVGAKVGSRIPLILVSALDPAVLAEIAAEVPHTHACPKPFSPSTLRTLVARVTGPSP